MNSLCDLVDSCRRNIKERPVPKNFNPDHHSQSQHLNRVTAKRLLVVWHDCLNKQEYPAQHLQSRYLHFSELHILSPTNHPSKHTENASCHISCRPRRSRRLLSHRLSAVSTAAASASTYGPPGQTARNQSYRSCETRSGAPIRTCRPFTIAASICLAQNQPVTFGAGLEYDGVSGSFSLDGNIHEGEICLFPRRPPSRWNRLVLSPIRCSSTAVPPAAACSSTLSIRAATFPA